MSIKKIFIIVWALLMIFLTIYVAWASDDQLYIPISGDEQAYIEFIGDEQANMYFVVEEVSNATTPPVVIGGGSGPPKTNKTEPTLEFTLEQLEAYTKDYISSLNLGLKYKITLFMPQKWLVGASNIVVAKVENIKEYYPIESVYFYLTRDCNLSTVLDSKKGNLLSYGLYYAEFTISKDYDLSRYCMTAKVFNGNYTEQNDVMIGVPTSFWDKIKETVNMLLYGSKNIALKQSDNVVEFLNKKVYFIIELLKKLIFGS